MSEAHMEIHLTDKEGEMLITAVTQQVIIWVAMLKTDPESRLAIEQLQSWQKLLKKIEEASAMKLIEIHSRTGLRIEQSDDGKYHVHDTYAGARIFNSRDDAFSWCEELYYAY